MRPRNMNFLNFPGILLLIQVYKPLAQQIYYIFCISFISIKYLLSVDYSLA